MYITRVQPQSLLSTFLFATHYSIKIINLSLGEEINQKSLKRSSHFWSAAMLLWLPPSPPPSFILEEIMSCICHDDGMIASFQDTFCNTFQSYGPQSGFCDLFTTSTNIVTKLSSIIYLQLQNSSFVYLFWWCLHPSLDC